MSKTSMTKVEREAFLAETRVGVFSVPEPDRGPLSVPVWYHYEPGGVVRFTTGGGSRKARAMRAGGRASLLVQTEIPPYKYASVEGPVRIVGAPDYERDVRAMAVRYLGAEMAEVYLATLASESQDVVLVELVPERWLTVDYGKAFA
jgi:PPOX class probable F420-dependent enzyme